MIFEYEHANLDTRAAAARRDTQTSASTEVLTNVANRLGSGAIIVGVRGEVSEARVVATARLFADDTRVALCV